MRSSKDRIRHTLMFEFFLVILIGPILSLILNQPVHKMGMLSIVLSLTAMIANYVYNIAFDYALKSLNKPIYSRSKKLRILHSILFELCLLFFSIPILMFGLNFTLLQALLLDVGFIFIVPIYAFFFNIIYDMKFPVTTS